MKSDGGGLRLINAKAFQVELGFYPPRIVVLEYFSICRVKVHLICIFWCAFYLFELLTHFK